MKKREWLKAQRAAWNEQARLDMDWHLSEIERKRTAGCYGREDIYWHVRAVTRLQGRI